MENSLNFKQVQKTLEENSKLVISLQNSLEGMRGNLTEDQQKTLDEELSKVNFEDVKMELSKTNDLISKLQF